MGATRVPGACSARLRVRLYVHSHQTTPHRSSINHAHIAQVISVPEDMQFVDLNTARAIVLNKVECANQEAFLKMHNWGASGNQVAVTRGGFQLILNCAHPSAGALCLPHHLMSPNRQCVGMPHCTPFTVPPANPTLFLMRGKRSLKHMGFPVQVTSTI